jgi:hypothetical protein
LILVPHFEVFKESRKENLKRFVKYDFEKILLVAGHRRYMAESRHLELRHD